MSEKRLINWFVSVFKKEKKRSVIVHTHGGSCTMQLEKRVAELEVLQKAQGWTPVGEGLPKNEQKVLFTLDDGGVCIGVYYASLGAGCAIAWMPLPEPYKE